MSTSHLQELASLIGSAHVLTAQQDVEPYLTDWRKRFTGTALAVVRPGSTQEVAQLVQWCAHNHISLVPQGGNTGLCGGATPDQTGQQVVLSLQRLNQITQVDTANNTITAQAGVVLQTLQETADVQDRLFPLSLAAEGTCTVGGVLATNAGGTQVLRYGNARDLCLGLEVVLPDGQVWNGLRGLRKDNTGYDLRNLMIGAEGTLGIITTAVLKLYAKPKATITALVAVQSPEQAVQLLSHMQSHCDAALTGFEMMSKYCLQLVSETYPQQRVPMELQTPYYVLLELSDHHSEQHAVELLETTLGSALEQELAQDVVIAQNMAQSHALWHLRESIPLAQAERGKNIKHDISVTVSKIAQFVRHTDALLQQHFPGVQNVTFGHLGDGNLHYNVSPGSYPIESEAQFLTLQEHMYELVHDSVASFNGSFSAEHGIGQLKRDQLQKYKSATEIATMRAIKSALDPQGIMNPGKVL